MKIIVWSRLCLKKKLDKYKCVRTTDNNGDIIETSSSKRADREGGKARVTTYDER